MKLKFYIMLIALCLLFGCQYEEIKAPSYPLYIATAQTKMHLGRTYPSMADSDTNIMQYAQNNIRQFGYDMRFDLYLDNASLSIEESNELYVAYLIEFLCETGTVAVVPGFIYKALQGKGALGSIMPQVREHAPAVLIKSESISEQAVKAEDCLPLFSIDALQYEYTYFDVLIPSELFAAYNADIRTYEDYTEYLAFAKAYAPHLVAGCIPTQAYASFGAYPIPNLYLLGAGYHPLDARFGLFIDPKGEVVAAEDTQEFWDALQSAAKLAEDGLVEFTTEKIDQPEKYASIMVNPADYSANPMVRWIMQMNANPRSMPLVDAEGYHLCVLYPDSLLSKTNDDTYYAVVGHNTDPTDFLCFLQQLNEDQALYNTIMYGVEGMDYTKNPNGNVVIEDTETDYALWKGFLFFSNEEFDYHMQLATTPYNYYDEMALLSYSSNELQAERYRKATELLNYSFEKKYTVLNKRNEMLRSMLEVLLMGGYEFPGTVFPPEAWPDVWDWVGDVNEEIA